MSRAFSEDPFLTWRITTAQVRVTPLIDHAYEVSFHGAQEIAHLDWTTLFRSAFSETGEYFPHGNPTPLNLVETTRRSTRLGETTVFLESLTESSPVLSTTMDRGVQKVVLSTNAEISPDTMGKLVSLRHKTFEEAVNESLPVPILGVIVVKTSLAVKSVSVAMQFGMEQRSILITRVQGKRTELVPPGETLVVWPNLSSFLNDQEWAELVEKTKLFPGDYGDHLSITELRLDVSPKKDLEMNTYTLNDRVEDYASFEPETVSKNGELVFVTDSLGSFYSNPNTVSKKAIPLGEITLGQSLKGTLYAFLSREEGLRPLQKVPLDNILLNEKVYPPVERISKENEVIYFSQPMCVTYTNKSSMALSVTLDLGVDCCQVLNWHEKSVSSPSLLTQPVLVLPTGVVRDLLNRELEWGIPPTLASFPQRILAFNTNVLQAGTVWVLSPNMSEGASLDDLITQPVVEGILYEVDSSLLTDTRFICEQAVGDNFPVSGLNEKTSRFRMKVMSPSLDLVSESEAQGAHVTSLDEDAVLWMPSLLVVQGSSGMNLIQQSSTGPFLP